MWHKANYIYNVDVEKCGLSKAYVATYVRVT